MTSYNTVWYGQRTQRGILADIGLAGCLNISYEIGNDVDRVSGLLGKLTTW